MSYSIWLTVLTEENERITIADIGNYTSNVAKMWQEALGHSLKRLHNKKCADFIDVLIKAVSDMKLNPKKYESMNPKNGWGCFAGALFYLEKLLEEAKKHPKALIEMSY